jgi:mannose-1-phosphate guanylyltransferase
VKAIVLVGGEGTRLRPLTFTTPKQLLPIAGVPMIERVIGKLASHGIDDVVLSMGYRADAFLSAYPDQRCAGVPIHYAVEPEPMDTAGAVRFAATWAEIDERFVVVNADVLTDVDLGDLVSLHGARGALATISLTPVADPSRFGVVPTDADGRVLAFIEKPPPGEAPTNLINAGIYVVEPEVVALIPGGRRVSIERETFPLLVEQGRLYALPSDAYWIDTGTPETYLRANLDVVGEGTQVGSGAVVDPAAVVERSVLGAGVRVDAGAKVVESVLLDHAGVGPRAIVRRSMVGAGACIGEGALLDDLTVVGDGAHVQPGASLSAARVPEPE